MKSTKLVFIVIIVLALLLLALNWALAQEPVSLPQFREDGSSTDRPK